MIFLRMIDCTQEQHSNKMTRQAIVGHMCLQRAPENMGYFNSGHALKKSSFTLFLKKIALKPGGRVGTSTQQSFHDP